MGMDYEQLQQAIINEKLQKSKEEGLAEGRVEGKAEGIAEEKL